MGTLRPGSTRVEAGTSNDDMRRPVRPRGGGVPSISSICVRYIDGRGLCVVVLEKVEEKMKMERVVVS